PRAVERTGMAPGSQDPRDERLAPRPSSTLLYSFPVSGLMSASVISFARPSVAGAAMAPLSYFAFVRTSCASGRRTRQEAAAQLLGGNYPLAEFALFAEW